MSRPGFQHRSGGNSRPGGHHNNNHGNNNYVHHNTNFNRAPMRAPANNNNTNTAPRTGSNAVPVTPKDKSTITCYECGVVGHFSNECPKRLAKIAANTAAPAQQQRRVSTGKKFTPNNPNNRGGRLFHMSAEEAQEAPDVVLGGSPVLGDHHTARPNVAEARHWPPQARRALDAPEHGAVPTRAPTPTAHSLHRASPPVPLRARHTRASPEDLSPSPPSKPCRGYRGMIIKRSSRPVAPRTLSLYPEPRHAVANRVLSSPCPLERRRGHAVDDHSQHSRHHLPSINRDLPRPSPSHHHDRLTSLLLLDQTIHPGAAAIWSLKPPEPADHRRRFTPPRASPLLPGASSPSTTPPRTL
ncbi:hypothetical protein QYE76_016746 [Lolium multiflorum]|uniref:CCHC-type domain-containing protein n=1 Tax=Lolium multiflorum TaxID=4521 RepID=A0AAD8PH87_LOLMU|nr:hypothetical protein QYE76_016746 [Lolium multiflorum]